VAFSVKATSVSEGGGVTSFRIGARRVSWSRSLWLFISSADSAHTQYVPSAQKPQDSARDLGVVEVIL
jgi:hypothetical protein